jgi:hypothetical protein
LPAGSRRRSGRDAYRERRALLDELALNATRWRTPRAFSIEADLATITRPPDPQDQLLAIFDIFDEWFHSDDFEASVFINALLEMGASHPTGQASVHYLENLRSVVAAMVQEAGLRDPEPFVRSWHILMQGSIVAAAEGDLDAAKRAQAMGRLLQAMGRLLLDQHRPPTCRPRHGDDGCFSGVS